MRQLDPQLLAGELARPADLEAFEAAGDAQPARYVVVHGHVREERAVLEDHRGATAVRRQLDAATADLDVALVGIVEPRDHAQRGRLPAAGGPKERGERALGHIE